MLQKEDIGQEKKPKKSEVISGYFTIIEIRVTNNKST